jgi:hypothetical protein
LGCNEDFDPVAIVEASARPRSARDYLAVQSHGNTEWWSFVACRDERVGYRCAVGELDL